MNQLIDPLIHPLESLSAYATFIAEIVHRPTVLSSTLSVWSDSPFTGIAEGEVHFSGGFRLRLREELDFHAHLIASYGYEVYRRDERLYWYDDFPHPQDPSLASTFPHHKHVPPDLRRNRVPASGMSFSDPNLGKVISEVEALIQAA